MKSIALFTEEIDDLDAAVEDLLAQYGDFEPAAHAAGIVFAHPDTDFGELAVRLKAAFKVPIIGVTSVAMLTQHGFKKEGISLHILSSATHTFRVGCTHELTYVNAKDEIRELYQRLTDGLDEGDIGLVMTYGSQGGSLIPEDLVKFANEIVGDKPIYGGFASDNFTTQDCKMFCDGEMRDHALGMVVITGELKPIIEYSFDVAGSLNYEATVTEVNGNMVMKLDGKPLTQALEEAGITRKYMDNFTDYVSTPFCVEYTTPEGDAYTIMRHLYFIDQRTGGAVFTGSVPLGAKLKLGIMSSSGVRNSVAEVANRTLTRVLESKDYKYSVLLITSCATRLMSFTNDISRQASDYVPQIPEGMTMSGFYAYGEVCPTKSNNSEARQNLLHNTSFSMLVI